MHDSILPLASVIIHLLSPRSQTSGSEEIRKIITFRFRLSVLFATRPHSRQSPPLFFFSMDAVRTRTIPNLLNIVTHVIRHTLHSFTLI